MLNVAPIAIFKKIILLDSKTWCNNEHSWKHLKLILVIHDLDTNGKKSPRSTTTEVAFSTRLTKRLYGLGIHQPVVFDLVT